MHLRSLFIKCVLTSHLIQFVWACIEFGVMLADVYGQIVEEGESEGFLDWLFGTNCYSKAVLSLSNECRQLSQEEQSRLALDLASCFLANSGKGSISCPGRQDVRSCTAKMDHQAFNTYQQFFLNVYRLDSEVLRRIVQGLGRRCVFG